MRDPFEKSSVQEVADNCEAGHCGCYYTNCNRCCRCKQVQIDRTLINRNVDYGDSRRDTPRNLAEYN